MPPNLAYWFSGGCVCALLPPNGQDGKYKGPHSPSFTQLCHIMTFEKTAEMIESLRFSEYYIFLEKSLLLLTPNTSPVKITEVIKNCTPIFLLNLLIDTQGNSFFSHRTKKQTNCHF